MDHSYSHISLLSWLDCSLEERFDLQQSPQIVQGDAHDYI